jgi:chromate transporter
VAFGEIDWVAGMFYGIKPAVAAIVLQAVWRIGSRTLRSPRKVPLLWAIAILSFVAIVLLKIPFPWVVLAAALAGAVGGKYVPAQFAAGGSHGAAKAQHHTDGAGFLIDDHTPTPPHARFSKSRLALVVLVGALLWVLPMAVLVWMQSWDGALTQMSWFFTKAALLTFGGAYAVLPTCIKGR